MTPQVVHTAGVNWSAVLTQVSLIGTLIGLFTAFLAWVVRRSRQFIGGQVADVTAQLGRQVRRLDRRTWLMSAAWLTGLVITASLAAADYAGGRRNRPRAPRGN
jgi:hypothetical protein